MTMKKRFFYSADAEYAQSDNEQLSGTAQTKKKHSYYGADAEYAQADHQLLSESAKCPSLPRVKVASAVPTSVAVSPAAQLFPVFETRPSNTLQATSEVLVRSSPQLPTEEADDHALTRGTEHVAVPDTSFEEVTKESFTHSKDGDVTDWRAVEAQYTRIELPFSDADSDLSPFEASPKDILTRPLKPTLLECPKKAFRKARASRSVSQNPILENLLQTPVSEASSCESCLPSVLEQETPLDLSLKPKTSTITSIRVESPDSSVRIHPLSSTVAPVVGTVVGVGYEECTALLIQSPFAWSEDDDSPPPIPAYWRGYPAASSSQQKKRRHQ